MRIPSSSSPLKRAHSLSAGNTPISYRAPCRASRLHHECVLDLHALLEILISLHSLVRPPAYFSYSSARTFASPRFGSACSRLPAFAMIAIFALALGTRRQYGDFQCGNAALFAPCLLSRPSPRVCMVGDCAVSLGDWCGTRLASSRNSAFAPDFRFPAKLPGLQTGIPRVLSDVVSASQPSA